jgi:multiple sugar transport system substrate-binding protein
MNKFNKLQNHFKADFKWQYWLLIFVFVILLSLHIIAQSTPSPPRFLKIIKDFLHDGIAAGVGAIAVFYLNDYKSKKLKIVPHVIYPFASGTLLLFAILLGVFSTVEIRMAGNGDGQFSGNEIQIINDDLSKSNRNINVSIGLDYNKLARQTKEEPHSVNVNKIYDILTKQIESGEENYDVYELDVIWIPYFVEKGWIIPLDLYREKSDTRYTFGIEQEVGRVVYKKDKTTLGKQTFAVPNFLNTGFLMYRVDLFHELIGKDGEPSSWDELVEWLYEIKEKYGDEYDGFVFQGDQYEGLMVNFFEILWAYGGEIYEVNGIPQVNTPEGIKTLKFFKKLLEDGIIPKDVLNFNEVKSLEHFRQGKTLVLRNWPRAFYSIQNHYKYKNLRNKVNVMTKPLAFRGVAKASAKTCLGGWFYAISKHAYETGKAKQVMEVIEHLTSKKQFNQAVYPTQFSERKGEYSIRIIADKEVLENAKGEKDALDYAYDYFKNRYYRARPEFSYYPLFSEILVKHIHQSLVNRDLSAEEALQNAQDELNKRIGNN